jgi:hypothetical protein
MEYFINNHLKSCIFIEVDDLWTSARLPLFPLSGKIHGSDLKISNRIQSSVQITQPLALYLLLWGMNGRGNLLCKVSEHEND